MGKKIASSQGDTCSRCGVARRRTRPVYVGAVRVGGGAPVSIQSMTTTDTRDVPGTLAQIRALSEAGCDIVRVAVPDAAAVESLSALVSGSPLPVVGDVHFDALLAVGVIESGVAGIRINPGNIGGRGAVERVARAARARGIPIRVGINGGSLEANILERYGGPAASALVESALRHCDLLEGLGVSAIKVSLKSSDVRTTVAANREFASRCDYPLHLGVTEAGAGQSGIVKSAVALGSLLLDGIGDTVRVSLTGPPVQEVRAALSILRALGLRSDRPEIVSCPTCGRTEIDLLRLVEGVEAEISRLSSEGKRVPFERIAIMGCVVNGPGEAREADVGVAGGRGKGVLFRHGEVVRSFPESELLDVLLGAIREAAVPGASGG